MPADLLDEAAVSWAETLPPTRSAALARIARVQPAAYARTRNHLSGAVTGLSPYLTHGLVTLPDVLAGVLQRGPLPVQHKLVFELGWREYFRHVWTHVGDGILRSRHPGPRADDSYQPRLPTDIREGRTGVPVVDTAVRTLYDAGTLHNHARLWLASYIVHLRHVHWRAGADWLVAHLLDGDLASNHLSWQWVAGTASHKPYLFNADNVARYAPAHWHSPGSVLDQPCEALERAARAAVAITEPGPRGSAPSREPMLLNAPPPDLRLQVHDAASAEVLRGRDVWLVHPWALRAPPVELSGHTAVIGLYLQEHHAAWPWPEARWRWVDAAMAAVAPQRWFIDTAGLVRALDGAASVRCIADPHLASRLARIAQLEPAPALFDPVERPCDSFSQWWSHVTRGLKNAAELL